MLQPRIRKYRKEFRGKMNGVASANNTIAFGEYGIKSMEHGWIEANQYRSRKKGYNRAY
jgi:large subunit ribosomal protein L16